MNNNNVKSWYKMGVKSGVTVDKFNRDAENIRKATSCIEKQTATPCVIAYWTGWMDGYKSRKPTDN